jgi:hypothetical protein
MYCSKNSEPEVCDGKKSDAPNRVDAFIVAHMPHCGLRRIRSAPDGIDTAGRAAA